VWHSNELLTFTSIGKGGGLPGKTRRDKQHIFRKVIGIVTEKTTPSLTGGSGYARGGKKGLVRGERRSCREWSDYIQLDHLKKGDVRGQKGSTVNRKREGVGLSSGKIRKKNLSERFQPLRTGREIGFFHDHQNTGGLCGGTRY